MPFTFFGKQPFYWIEVVPVCNTITTKWVGSLLSARSTKRAELSNSVFLSFFLSLSLLQLFSFLLMSITPIRSRERERAFLGSGGRVSRGTKRHKKKGETDAANCLRPIRALRLNKQYQYCTGRN